MIVAELTDEDAGGLRLVFEQSAQCAPGRARCEIAAEASDGDRWSSDDFSLSLRDVEALLAFCSPDDTAEEPRPFESELDTWLMSRWKEDETVVIEVGVRSETSARRAEGAEEAKDGLDLMVRTRSPELIAFGHQVASGVSFALGAGDHA